MKPAADETPSVDVLIVGAGPTGLVLALWLTRAGVRVRIIDQAAEPGTTSRALIVHARTLELYRQLGFAAKAVAAGQPFAALNMWVRGRHVGRAVLGDIGAGVSPFPYMIVLPQDEHERLLIAELERSGVTVERRTELAGLEELPAGISARVHTADGGEERVLARYVAGCDGARSAVRKFLGIEFPGGTYERMFYVADIEASAATDKELHVALDDADFVAVFPMAGAVRTRLIGTIREDALRGNRPLSWDDVSGTALSHLPIEVTRVNWFSTYHVHHRVANHFRKGPAFLLGDAGHIHSPVGGQGMNTGIGDAVNLAWKLADVLQGRSGEKILDSYEPERIAFARRLVATTDRAFTFVTKDGPIARFVRLHVVPTVVPKALRSGRLRRFFFRTVSQTAINYRGSPLSAGRAGDVSGGDRLPWVPAADGSGGDNFAPLESRSWHVHVYGEASAVLRASCDRRSLPLVAFPWRAEMREAGLGRDALYLVRPDGYVALADPAASAAALDTFLESRR